MEFRCLIHVAGVGLVGPQRCMRCNIVISPNPCCYPTEWIGEVYVKRNGENINTACLYRIPADRELRHNEGFCTPAEGSTEWEN